jgi:hypothetical protein
VTLRDERWCRDWWNLWAYLDQEGNLHIDEQDLGPGTAPVGTDGEYVWFQEIALASLPRPIALLSGEPREDVLDLLERDWTGARSYELERRLRESGIPRERHIWSG